MLTSKVKIAGDVKLEPVFPCIYRSQGGDTVLFVGYTRGIQLNSESRGFKMGYYSETWINCTEADTWTALPKGSSITITVE